MQTAIFRIKTIDKREFRVFCANKSQVQMVSRMYHKSDNLISIETIESGIHTTKEFEEIINSLYNK